MRQQKKHLNNVNKRVALKWLGEMCASVCYMRFILEIEVFFSFVVHVANIKALPGVRLSQSIYSFHKRTNSLFEPNRIRRVHILCLAATQFPFIFYTLLVL